jgi:hypothetical protein
MAKWYNNGYTAYGKNIYSETGTNKFYLDTGGESGFLLGTRTWGNGKYTYNNGTGVVRLEDGSEVLNTGGYKSGGSSWSPSDPITYKIDASETGKVFSLPADTQRLPADGSFELPDGTVISGKSKKMPDGSFEQPSGKYKLTNTSSNKVNANKAGVDSDVSTKNTTKDAATTQKNDAVSKVEDLDIKTQESTMKMNTMNRRYTGADLATKNKRRLRGDTDGERSDIPNRSAEAKEKRVKMSTVDKVTTLAGLAALFAYLQDEETAFATSGSDSKKGCVMACLPKNYTDYHYGNIAKEDLIYSTLDNFREEFRELEVEAEQPFCTEENFDCMNHCIAACANRYDTKPGDEDEDEEEEPWWKKWFPDVDENLITSVIVAILVVIIIAFLIMIFSLYSS